MRESYDSNLKKAMHLYAQKSAEDLKIFLRTKSENKIFIKHLLHSRL